jgi:hypothetical protein
MTAPAIFSRRRRFCFFVRTLPLPLALAAPPRPAGGRPRLGPFDGAPLRAAVVRPPRPPGGGLRGPPEPPAPRPPLEPSDPRPPPPVLRVRVVGGRRTEPARGATGEVSSCGGTRQNPSLAGRGRRRDVPGRSVSSAVAARRRRARSYSVAARRRFFRGARPGVGSAPRTYEASRWFQPHERQTSTEYTVNSSCMASIRASSASVLA